MAAAGELTSLVSVKAVGNGYPRRGVLKLARESFGAMQNADGIPPRGTAWVDARLLADLQIPLDQQFQLGTLTLKATALIAYEPDRSGGFTDLAPRVIIDSEDLAASGLLSPGSRASYTLQLTGSAAQLAAAKALPRDSNTRWRGC